MKRGALPGCRLWCWATLACLTRVCAPLGWATPACAQSVGDANCDGSIDAADLVAVEGALFERRTCPASDVNADRLISAADLSAEVPLVVLAQLPTATATMATPTPTVPTSTPTATLTPTLTATATASATPTATLVVCPTAAAAVLLTIDNQTGASPISVTVSGRRSGATCTNSRGLDETYSVVVSAGSQTVGHLAPGSWVHTLSVESTGQREHQPSLVLANAGSNRVRFTVVASVATVSTSNDDGTGSLREALSFANAAPSPVRVQCDENAFPPGIPTVITLASALPTISGSGITLDGIDATGAAGNRVIDAGGLAMPGLAISGAGNTIIGMRVRNAGGNNRDVVSIAGANAHGNVIDHCIIDQSATGDTIGIGNDAGADFLASANVIRDSEVFASSDKGIKVTTNAYTRVERTWVHDNANGGIQSTLSGHVFARDNVVERSRGATAQNGLSVNGAAPNTPTIASELTTDGNLARFNAGDGISVRGLSLGFINNDALLANGNDGIRVFDENGAAAAVVQGIAAACNAVDGAAVSGTSQADFGGGQFGSAGNNAFTQNNLPAGADNLRNSTGDLVFAENSQWEHCGVEAQCADSAITAYDVSDHGARTIVAPSQAHRTLRPPVITSVRPAKALAGGRLRIFGSGFNTIDGYFADAACPDIAGRNHCTPLRGNCVRINDVPAGIEAVTPTMLVVRMPFACVAPQLLTVQTQGGGTSPPFTVCTNAGD